ncbi:MAG: protein RarD [Micrococcales bacterium]|nr:protein RarD [Micrococcales bacterium]
MIAGKSGAFYGVLAYTLWGIFPLYFTLLEPATPLEILANRIIWSLVVCFIVLIAARRLHQLRHISRRQALLLSAAGILLSINWLTFVYAVTTDQVVEASLGYFINPLVTVALGVLVLQERLNRAQWSAIALAATAVLILAVNYGRIPWIALTLALSFAGYGLLKKRANVPAFESLTFETLVLLVPALAFQIWLYIDGTETLTGYGLSHTVLLVGLGIITTLPLVLFGAAAIRIPLTSLGILQYIAPVLQFLIGVVVLGETMPPARWFGFILVWVALIIFTWDLVRRTKSRSQLTQLESPQALD